MQRTPCAAESAASTGITARSNRSTARLRAPVQYRMGVPQDFLQFSRQETCRPRAYADVRHPGDAGRKDSGRTTSARTGCRAIVR